MTFSSFKIPDNSNGHAYHSIYTGEKDSDASLERTRIFTRGYTNTARTMEPCSIALSSSHFLRVIPWDASPDWPHSYSYFSSRGNLSQPSRLTSGPSSSSSSSSSFVATLKVENARTKPEKVPGAASVFYILQLDTSPHPEDNDPKPAIGRFGKVPIVIAIVTRIGARSHWRVSFI